MQHTFSASRWFSSKYVYLHCWYTPQCSLLKCVALQFSRGQLSGCYQENAGSDCLERGRAVIENGLNASRAKQGRGRWRLTFYEMIGIDIAVASVLNCCLVLNTPQIPFDIPVLLEPGSCFSSLHSNPDVDRSRCCYGPTLFQFWWLYFTIWNTLHAYIYYYKPKFTFLMRRILPT